MRFKEKMKAFDLFFIVGALVAIVALLLCMGLFGLICSKTIAYNQHKSVIVEEKGDVLKAVEQDLIKHGKIGKR